MPYLRNNIPSISSIIATQHHGRRPRTEQRLQDLQEPSCSLRFVIFPRMMIAHVRFYTLTDQPPDEAKPICQRCTKAGFPCLGYERPTLWRNTYTSDPPAACRPPAQASKPKKKPSSPAVAPHRGLGLIAFQWDIYMARMFDNFIWRSYGAGWLDQAAKGNLGDLSLDAVKALSQFSFGQSNRTPDIKVQGDAQYGKCITVILNEIQKGTSLATSGHCLFCPILILTMVAVSVPWIGADIKVRLSANEPSAFNRTERRRFPT